MMKETIEAARQEAMIHFKAGRWPEPNIDQEDIKKEIEKREGNT
jgi:hypothetical protein